MGNKLKVKRLINRLIKNIDNIYACDMYGNESESKILELKNDLIKVKILEFVKDE